jgi:hypothetical protein
LKVSGDHVLGGERRGRAAVAAWFEQLQTYFPYHNEGMQFAHLRFGRITEDCPSLPD